MNNGFEPFVEPAPLFHAVKPITPDCFVCSADNHRELLRANLRKPIIERKPVIVVGWQKFKQALWSDIQNEVDQSRAEKRRSEFALERLQEHEQCLT